MDAEQNEKKFKISMNDHEGETSYISNKAEADRLLQNCKDEVCADLNRLPDVQSVMCLITTKDAVIHHGSGERDELVDALATEMVKSPSFAELIARATVRAMEITIFGEDDDDEPKKKEAGDD